jgi:hypothetical protein
VAGTNTVVSELYVGSKIYFGNIGSYGTNTTTGFALNNGDSLCWQLFTTGKLALVTFSMTLNSNANYSMVAGTQTDKLTLFVIFEGCPPPLTGTPFQYQVSKPWTCSGNFPAVARWPLNWLATPDFQNQTTPNNNGVVINSTVTSCNVVNMTSNVNPDTSLRVSFTIGGNFILTGTFMAANFLGPQPVPGEEEMGPEGAATSVTINGNISYLYA